MFIGLVELSRHSYTETFSDTVCETCIDLRK
jgi:hypothetical protein